LRLSPGIVVDEEEVEGRLVREIEVDA